MATGRSALIINQLLLLSAAGSGRSLPEVVGQRAGRAGGDGS